MAKFSKTHIQSGKIIRSVFNFFFNLQIIYFSKLPFTIFIANKKRFWSLVFLDKIFKRNHILKSSLGPCLEIESTRSE